MSKQDMPLVARIVALADAFTSKRIYKEAFSFEVAKKMIIEGNGTQFNPIIVEIF